MSQGMQNDSHAALIAAQKFHQQLKSHAAIAQHQQQWLTRGVVFLGLLAMVLAILPCAIANSADLAGLIQACQVGLVLVGLVFIVLVGVSNRSQNGQAQRVLAAGVAATERAIYLYRTLLQYTPSRGIWLNQQIATVQQQVQERLGRNILCPATPALTEVGNSEPGNVDATDLLAEGYLQQRLLPQLEQAMQQVKQVSAIRNFGQLMGFICAGLVVLLPVVNPNWLSLAAIAAACGITLFFWLRNSALDRWLEVYGQLILGLTLLRDYWQSLPMSDQTGQTFFRLVIASETLLEDSHAPIEHSVSKSMDLLQADEPDLIQTILSQPAPTALEQSIQRVALTNAPDLGSISEREILVADAPVEIIESAKIVETVEIVEMAPDVVGNGKVTLEPKKAEPTKTLQITQLVPEVPTVVKRGRPHAFVVMPFGRKQAADGRWIDFNSIYQNLIKPALEEAGFESFRADEEVSSGDILTDMFQELLLAELVIADLSIDNANVFYELGIRHAFRRRGVVHIQAGRSYMPFDIFNVRTLPYHCDDTGCPDYQFLGKDKQALVNMIQATWTSERNRVHSPVFNLLTGLVEPDRKTLRTPQATGYWQEYTTLQSRIAIAQRQKRIGDVVLLAEEVSNPLVKEDIITDAGKALKSMGNSALALKQYRQGLKINPENVTFRCEEAFHLSRLGQSDEAIVKLESVIQDMPNCVEAMSYLARIYKDLWKQNWVAFSEEIQRIRAAYEASYLLQKSIENYLRGYQLDQNQYYPGINALTLTALLDHLARTAEFDNGDADEASYRSKLPALKGSIQFCLESNLHKSPNDQWAAISLGDLAVCVAESPTYVATAYRKALAILWNNKFALQATLDQLKLMKLLNFRPEHVQAGIAVLQPELDRCEQQEQLFARTDAETMAKPAQVFLFSGHMIDSPNRAKPRFPAAMEAEAAERLDQSLDKLGAYANCIAIIPGLACGGDILFAEACLKRDLQVEVYLPFEASEFIQDSVSFAGDSWVGRFYNILNHPNITLHLQSERLGAVLPGDSPYERNNRWALYSTLMHDISRVRLIALWNGQGGDGLGGTADMVQQVRQLGGIVEHIDITKFEYWREVDRVAEGVKE